MKPLAVMKDVIQFTAMEKLIRETSERKLSLPVGKSDWDEVTGHCNCVDKTQYLGSKMAYRELAGGRKY